MNRDDQKAIINVVKSIYHPSLKERKIKAAYWQLCKEGPSRKHTIKEAAELMGEPGLVVKADNAGFVQWFFNEQEFTQRLHYLANLGLDVVEDILIHSDRDSDRLKAVSLVNDLVKAASKVEDEGNTGDAMLDEMSDEELDKYIEENSK